jgi:signal peptidase I
MKAKMLKHRSLQVMSDDWNREQKEQETKKIQMETEEASAVSLLRRDREKAFCQKTAKKNRIRKLYRIACYICLYACLFMLSGYVIPTYVCGKVTVEGNSMQNTLHDGDHLINEKVTYYFEKPKRFDIVIVTPYTTKEQAGQDDDYWVKRVIGLPGETIRIKGGQIYINGELLEEDIYGNGEISYAGIAEEEYLIPSGQYFLMGDNRSGAKSYDSRYEEVGTFSENQIIGKVVFRLSPLFGTVD